MTQKIADDFIKISARLRELERRQKVIDDPEHICPVDSPFEHYAICPECNGRGGHTVPHPSGLPAYAACTYCNGSGTVSIRRTP